MSQNGNMRAVFFFFLIFYTSSGLLGKTYTIDSYIEAWKDVAILQMQTHHIPASITLAQGILESGYGNSELAQKANNHFGIKCHDWKGPSIRMDDDKKNECFRKYASADQSFEDHSEFLTSRARYASLFDLEITDYKGWANGLKEAGYATNPKYPSLLIDLIHRYDLNVYDRESLYNSDMIAASTPSKTKNNLGLDVVSTEGAKQTAKREIRNVEVLKNRTKYVIVKEGDTFFQLAKEFNMTLRQLHKYNDFPPTKDHLKAGDIVFLTPKKKKSSKNQRKVTLDTSKELWQISQQYGIKLKSLMQINAIPSPDFAMQKGEVVFLR